MKIKSGNMWDHLHEYDIAFFTANSTVNYDKASDSYRLVMGGGCAKEALQFFPGSDEVFGNIISNSELNNGIFGLIFVDNVVTRNGLTTLGAFQTKQEVWKPSTLALVEYSINLLHAVCHNWESIALPMPGAGLGGLDINDVLPLVETLPDNITIWTYEKEKVVTGLKVADKLTSKITGLPLKNSA